jgi:hypothetical protein
MPYGVATPTIASSPVPFSYPGTGAAVALGIGFIPSAVQFYGGTLSWAWVRGMAFGAAYALSGTAAVTVVTGGVLDVLDGSGVASANTATTSQVIGLLIGSSSSVNNGGVTYFGLCYR